MADFKNVTERYISLAWNDIEPKLLVGLTSGAVVGFLLSISAAYGFVLPTPVPEVLELLSVGLAGYIKKTVQKQPIAQTAVKVPLPTADQVAAETLPTTPS